jgi:hypothetical protein
MSFQRRTFLTPSLKSEKIAFLKPPDVVSKRSGKVSRSLPKSASLSGGSRFVYISL